MLIDLLITTDVSMMIGAVFPSMEKLDKTII